MPDAPGGVDLAGKQPDRLRPGGARSIEVRVLARQVRTGEMFGEKTDGIDAHVTACQSYQAAVPENKVLEHSVRMAAGDWTAVISNAEGGVNFVTVAKWKNGAIIEEYIMGVK